ncbi:PAS domain-containing sensor histidine kinase [Halocynthiibacter sp. C4]|uniref:sensor histidine kinase NtrY-like n=1 Tax=Halocynthiibacter sp. C4 TaxID=2992758 RepID=UPI00237A6FC0|nr:PAS domain-containing sensor histidine kinase [Halocynthiibacter sp. C4]MDE0589568.1 PAS domain-containing sensor histidine kinase [Halocynthiibacter sp. C4]
MPILGQSATINRLSRLRRQRKFQNIATLGLVVLGPILAAATFVVLGPYEVAAGPTALRLILLADLVYALLVASLVLQRVVQMIAARRAKSAGSRLHLRLTGVFAVVALLPTILVAVFAMLTVNVGIEGWFSERVREVVSSSLDAAQAYEAEHHRFLVTDAEALADRINLNALGSVRTPDGDLREFLNDAQQEVNRNFREAFVIDGAGEIRARGVRSYLFDYERPSDDDLARADAGETVVIRDWNNNEFRALVSLSGLLDRYLYVSRDVDGEILNLLDETQETVSLYQQLEKDRGKILFEFGLLYLGFAVILILAAIWLGLWFAERLSRPVGRLTSAAQRVGSGDMSVQVLEERGDDEIAMLGRYFNQMMRQLRDQREALLDNTRQIEARRRQFDSVLNSVTSGVVGLDAEGRVDFVNRSARRLLALSSNAGDEQIAVAVPEFGAFFERTRKSRAEIAQEEVRVTRDGKLENLLVRISPRRNSEGGLEGYVIAFDDVTDLVTAQRMAAWGDVARRIAHEIKNPLTPIQLSAERIKRKFSPRLEEADAETLAQMTEVIVRKTDDLRRIVDEFSKFARMPEPELREHDLNELLRDAVVLQTGALGEVTLSAEVPDGPCMSDVDATMIAQALTNIIKNAGEGVETHMEKGVPEGFDPQVRIEVETNESEWTVRISDNGIGFPADRTRLFEPYVTTRDKGTGLGLPIVKKIVEEHGGTLALLDAEKFGNTERAGACVAITLPWSAATTGREVGQ